MESAFEPPSARSFALAMATPTATQTSFASNAPASKKRSLAPKMRTVRLHHVAFKDVASSPPPAHKTTNALPTKSAHKAAVRAVRGLVLGNLAPKISTVPASFVRPQTAKDSATVAHHAAMPLLALPLTFAKTAHAERSVASRVVLRAKKMQTVQNPPRSAKQDDVSRALLA